MDLKDELLQEVQQIEATEETAIVKTPRMGMKVPVGVRKDKMAKIMSMMDRESALVEAAKNRLERLALEG